jgi:phosphoesterase family protein
MIPLLLAGVLLCICSGAERHSRRPHRLPRRIPKYDQIVVVIEENRAYSNIIGDLADAPFINTTLVPKAAVMTNFHAEAHPSEPNYFALYGGSTFGVTDDGNYDEPDPSLYTILNGAVPSLTFAGYVESSDTNRRAPDGTTLAVRKHNPWESFPEGKSVEKDFSSFPDDFTQLPVVCWVIPNLNNDMHDGTIAQGDEWLKNHISAYATWCQTHNSLLIITWDEDDTENLVPNRIPTLIIGRYVKPGTYSENVNHYNLLSTIVASQGLKGPRNAATVAPITDIFSTTAQ